MNKSVSSAGSAQTSIEIQKRKRVKFFRFKEEKNLEMKMMELYKTYGYENVGIVSHSYSEMGVAKVITVVVEITVIDGTDKITT